MKVSYSQHTHYFCHQERHLTLNGIGLSVQVAGLSPVDLHMEHLK